MLELEKIDCAVFKENWKLNFFESEKKHYANLQRFKENKENILT